MELKTQFNVEKRRREEAESDLETHQQHIRSLKSEKATAATAYQGEVCIFMNPNFGVILNHPRVF